MKPGALLYSNTSGIDIDIMANATKRPQDVAGTHFFAPANVMKLFEVVKGAKSAPDTLATGDGSRPQDRQDQCHGRQWRWLCRQPQPHALWHRDDHHGRGGGIARAGRQGHGRFRLSDRAVRDRRSVRARYRLRQPPAPRRAKPELPQMPIADAIVEMGRLGQKTGAGWFRYEQGDRTPHPDPEVARIIKEKAAEMGVEQRKFSDEEILRRLLFASVNEACKILDEGKAYRASDIDVMWLNGFGFPRYRGGLMYWADGIGVGEVYRQIAAWHQQYGERWAPSPLPAPSRRNQHPLPRRQTRPPNVIGCGRRTS